MSKNEFPLNDFAVTWIVGDERLYIGGAYINRLQHIEVRCVVTNMLISLHKKASLTVIDYLTNQDLVVLQVAEPHSDSQVKN